MVPDFSKFFGKISLSRHDSTEPRLSSGSWGQKLYVHIEERHGCPTLGGPALIFQNFSFLKLDCSQLRASFDDPIGANESARQAGSIDTVPNP